MTDWYQQALTAPEVVEVRVRIGVILESDHAQAMVEILDPITGVLIGSWSNPHVPSSQWLTLVEQAAGRAQDFLAGALEPF